MATKWQIENKEHWKAYMKAYRQRPEAMAKHRERVRLKRISDPEWAKAKNEKAVAWHVAHREYALRKRKEWYRKNAKEICQRQKEKKYREYASKLQRAMRERNPELVRERERRYRSNNPEKRRCWKRNRYARKRNAVGFCTDNQLQQRFIFHGNRCIYCLRETRLTVEHMIPLSRGGSNWPANLAPACRKCNSRKHDKTYLEYMALIQ